MKNKRTLFNTPLLSQALHYLAKLIIFLSGWRVDVQPPQSNKGILIGAPHTSNWDFPMMLLAILVWRVEAYWIGKHTLFAGPAGPVMRFLGGIAINRQSSQDFTEQVAKQFHQHENMLLVIAPEGTRAAVDRWRSGFYYMAVKAGVPIVLSFVDYKEKRLGVGSIEIPCGDAAADIKRYHAFYAQKTGKNPANFNKNLTQD